MLSLIDYARLVEPTDKMPPELAPILFGLFGEVGSVMAASKKYHREKEVYVGFRQTAVEEFGDVLWYFTAICRRLGIQGTNFERTLVGEVEGQGPSGAVQIALLPPDSELAPAPQLDPALLRLGEAAAALLTLANELGDAPEVLSSFGSCYLEALKVSNMSLGEIAAHNAAKTVGRFVEPDPASLPRFDDEFDDDERIPDQFEIFVTQRKSGKSHLQWNGVFLGDPLTDNIADEDGYRFHDVFHLAHAAVLHWSPVFRALIKHKRKSDPAVDEAQDSGRPIVIEEGLTAWIFSQAKAMGFFDGRDSVSFDLLKEIQTFVAGYEVERCPLKLWEHAILQGYRAFLLLRKHNGGVLIGDRSSRTLRFKPLMKDHS